MEAILGSKVQFLGKVISLDFPIEPTIILDLGLERPARGLVLRIGAVGVRRVRAAGGVGIRDRLGVVLLLDLLRAPWWVGRWEAGRREAAWSAHRGVSRVVRPRVHCF